MVVNGVIVNTCLLEKISRLEAIPIKYHWPLGKNEANYDAFIAFILAYRIATISQDRGSGLQPSEADHTFHLWERLYTCVSNQITRINHEIATMGSNDVMKNRVLTRIQGIKCVELMLQSPMWRRHTEGFLSLLRFCGGAKFAQERLALIRNSKGIIMQVRLYIEFGQGLTYKPGNLSWPIPLVRRITRLSAYLTLPRRSFSSSMAGSSTRAFLAPLNYLKGSLKQITCGSKYIPARHTRTLRLLWPYCNTSMRFSQWSGRNPSTTCLIYQRSLLWQAYTNLPLACLV